MFRLEMTLAALGPVLLALLFYWLEKKTKFGKIPYWWRQIIIGVVFGISASLATQFGVPSDDGYVMNVRSASPLTAGLIFGGPAGIISGVIGGLYRWFSVYWGIGSYTRVACSVATVIAGLFAALGRKFMFDNKKATWFYGLFIGIVTETFHMLLVFLTHMEDIDTAFKVVKACTIPMVVSTALSVTASLLIISALGKPKDKLTKKDREITQTFSRSLMISVVIAYFVTSMFTFNLQQKIADTDVSQLLTQTIQDVKQNIDENCDEYILTLAHSVAVEIDNNAAFEGIGLSSSEDQRAAAQKRLNEYKEKYGVTEINIVDYDSVIVASTTEENIGYALNSKTDGQGVAFLCLLQGTEEYVQDFSPVDKNPSLKYKYAGVVLESGGFVQVGDNAETFRELVVSNLAPVAKNRHIGNSGFVFIIDDTDYKVVSAPTGTVTDENASKFIPTMSADDDFTVQTFTTAEGEEYYCMYSHVEGYIAVAAMPASEANYSRDISVYIGIFMQVVVFALLFIQVYIMIKHLVINNIHKINSSLTRITEGDLDTVVDVRTLSEFSSLSDDINHTVAKLKDCIREAAERIDKELEFAKTIQASALPSVFPPYPNKTEIDIFASMDTAKEVGGDFYDFYLLGEDKLAFLIADVSGKGIPAAMFMMTSKTMLKSFAESGLAPADVFTQTNDELCKTNEAGMFVTAWMGVLDLKTGVVRFANAGHNPPVLRHANGDYTFLQMRPGFVLAGMEGVHYKEFELTLNPGDEIFLYTDGLTEANNADKELFGNDRLLDAMNGLKDTSAELLCKSIKSKLDEFVGNADQFDDITMLSLKYKGGQNK